jgi:protein-tyrosine phosphatase
VSFQILTVCTGNVCRSPMAELLLRAWADPRAQLGVSSAGMRAMVDHAIDRGSATALGQLGIDPTRHRARQFEPWMAGDADLILTAERAHRDQVMIDVPSAFKRTFTMKEFARLAPTVRSADARIAVLEASAGRPSTGPVPLEDDDMPDPYRRATKHAKTIAQQITEAVQVTLDMLSFSPRRMYAERPLPNSH